MPKKYISQSIIPFSSILVFITAIVLTGCKKEKTAPTRGDVGEDKQYKPEEIQPGVVVGSIHYTRAFNAFTDLTHYQNKWFCVFREGSQHIGGKYGVIKVLTSTDGRYWKVDQEISKDSIDLRDPKLVIDSTAKELHVTFFGIDYSVTGRQRIRNFFTSYIPSDPHPQVEEIDEKWPNNTNYYMWRWTPGKTEAYCMAYRLSRYEDTTTNLILLSGQSRYQNRRVIKSLNLFGQPTESTIRFEEQRMFVAVRSEATNMYLGYADAPYNSFNWFDNVNLPRLASPNFLFYGTYMLITGRDLSDSKFKLFAYNLQTREIKKTITFVGGYEVGYGGMSFNPEDASELWISYYSIEHGGLGSNIYLSKLDLNRALN